MNQRTTNSKNSIYQPVLDDKKKRIAKKQPLQLVFSTLPQLAITFAVLFFSFSSANATFQDFSGITFYISFLSGVIICSIFLILQLGGAEYKNWEKDPKTRKYIQIASGCSLISFIGFNISLWPLFYVLTPVIIFAGFAFVLSALIILTAFFPTRI